MSCLFVSSAAVPPIRSLCTAGERVVFSCALKSSQKMVSLCASKDLSRDHGYLEYRFGVPAKIELTFPSERKGSAQSFQYSHYFRAQVDLTEIKFSNAGVDYSVFSDFNGEEKPAVSQHGITVKPEHGKDVRMNCGSKAIVDFGGLEDVLPHVIE